MPEREWDLEINREAVGKLKDMYYNSSFYKIYHTLKTHKKKTIAAALVALGFGGFIKMDGPKKVEPLVRPGIERIVKSMPQPIEDFYNDNFAEKEEKKVASKSKKSSKKRSRSKRRNIKRTRAHKPVRIDIPWKRAYGIVVNGERKYSIKMGGLGPLMEMLRLYGNYSVLDKGDTLVLKGKYFTKAIKDVRKTSKGKNFDAKYSGLESIMVWKNSDNWGIENLCNFKIRLKPDRYEIPETDAFAVIRGDIGGYTKFDFPKGGNEYAVLYFYIGKNYGKNYRSIKLEIPPVLTNATKVDAATIRLAEMYRKEGDVIGRVWALPYRSKKVKVRNPLILEHNLSKWRLRDMGFKADWEKNIGYFNYEKLKKRNPRLRPKVDYPLFKPWKLL